MSQIKNSFFALMLCAPLAACGGSGTPDSTPATDAPTPAPTADAAEATTPDTTIGRKVKEATDKARRELATSNISVSDAITPKAEITPAGDLLIAGNPIEINADQRQLLLDYRSHVIKIAEAGIDIGVQGANLGVKAAGEALKGIFSGNTEQIESRINDEARKIEASASRICDLLPAMRDTQTALAASLPAFQPYARMDQKEIDDCKTSGRWSSK